MNFENKYAVITGITDQFAQNTLKLLAQNNLKGVIITGIHANDEIDTIAQEISQNTHCQCIPFALDMSSPQSIEALFQFACEQFPQIDIFINAARVYPTTLIENIDSDDWDNCMDINLKGAHLCTREAVKIMQPRQYGKIVHITSLLTTRINGQTPSASYIASQGGLMTLLKYYAKQYATDHININAVCPNLRTKENDENTEQTDSVASTIAFLVSDLAKDITGENIDISGRGCYCNRIL